MGGRSHLEAGDVVSEVGLGRVGVGAGGREGEGGVEGAALEPQDLFTSREEAVLHPSPSRVLAPPALEDAPRGGDDKHGALAEDAWGDGCQ